MGHEWRSWVSLCATSQKASGSIPNSVIEFFIGIVIPTALWPWDQLSLSQKWVPEMFSWGLRRPVPRADNLATFICRLSWNLGASSSRNTLGLNRPERGFIYPFFVHISKKQLVLFDGELHNLLLNFPQTQRIYSIKPPVRGRESTNFTSRQSYVMCCNGKRRFLLLHSMCSDKMRFLCLNQTQQYVRRRILIQRSGLAEGYTVPSRTVPLDLRSGSGFVTDSETTNMHRYSVLDRRVVWKVLRIQKGGNKRNLQEIAQWGAS